MPHSLLSIVVPVPAGIDPLSVRVPFVLVVRLRYIESEQFDLFTRTSLEPIDAASYPDLRSNDS